jgi:hypothetical protein
MIRRKKAAVPCFAIVPTAQTLGKNLKRSVKCKNEEATRQQGSLFSRENSSNGALKSVKTFCANLMSLKTGVSSDFCEINVFVFK